MTRNHHKQMVDRGRKAGLSTREIYRALASQPAEGSEQAGQFDGNGMVCTVAPDGHPVFRAVVAPVVVGKA